jgi:hypothetical protein
MDHGGLILKLSHCLKGLLLLVLLNDSVTFSRVLELWRTKIDLTSFLPDVVNHCCRRYINLVCIISRPFLPLAAFFFECRLVPGGSMC